MDFDDAADSTSSLVAMTSLPGLISPSPTTAITSSDQFSDHNTPTSRAHGVASSPTDRPGPSSPGWRGARTSVSRQVHACQRCRQKKIKCDAALPTCTGCATTGQPCTMVDIITGKQYERRYVAELESRVHELEALVNNAEANYGPAETSPQEGNDQSGNSARGGMEQSPASQFVGESSEINFARLLIANIRSKRAATLQAPKLPKLTETLMAVRIGTVESVNTEPSDLPHHTVASELVRSYCFGSHILCPCILRDDIVKIFDAVYEGADRTEPPINGLSPYQRQQQPQNPSPQDLFRLYMIMAIGSVTPHVRQDQPLAYYKSAMLQFRSIPSVVGLEAAQNLLLLAEFALVHDTGSSIWDIARFCMRICVLLDLHKEDPFPGTSTDSRTLLVQRLVFWSCYTLDRVSSSVLGRPFAISDRDISAKLPEESTSDGDRHAIGRIIGQASAEQLPHETATFCSYISLRRISSEISTYFYRLRRKRSSGQITQDVNKFLSQMEVWRQSVQSGDNSNNLEIVFLREEGLDYAVAKEKLSLARAAINLVVSGESLIPQDLRDLCLHAGLAIIHSSSAMFSGGRLTCNRLNFHVLFSASVSCLYCLLVECCEQLGLRVDEMDLSPGGDAINGALESLYLSVRVLKQMASSLSDLNAYSMALEAIVHQLRGSRAQESQRFEQSGEQRGAEGDQTSPSNRGGGMEPFQADQQLQQQQQMLGPGMDMAGVPPSGQYEMPGPGQPLMEMVTPADWQSIGTGMWQCVEPEWNNFGDGGAGLSEMGWNDDFLEGIF